jgi:hypothetical protein
MKMLGWNEKVKVFAFKTELLVVVIEERKFIALLAE